MGKIAKALAVVFLAAFAEGLGQQFAAEVVIPWVKGDEPEDETKVVMISVPEGVEVQAERRGV